LIKGYIFLASNIHVDVEWKLGGWMATLIDTPPLSNFMEIQPFGTDT